VNAVDQRMSQYVNVDTKEVVAMMNTVEKCGEGGQWVRKDVYDRMPKTPAATVKVEPKATK